MLLAFTLSSTPPPATRRTCVVTWRASCLDAAFLHIRTCCTVQSQACLGVPLLAFTLFVVVSPDTPTHTRRHLTHGLLSTQPFPTFEPVPLCRFRPPAAYRCLPLLFRRRLHRRPDANAPSTDARAARRSLSPPSNLLYCADSGLPRRTAAGLYPFRRRLARRTDAHASSPDARTALDAAFLYLRTCSTVQIQACLGVPLLAFTPFRRRLARRTDAHASSPDARTALDAAFLYLRTCSTVQIQAPCGLPLLAFTLSSTPPPAPRRKRPVY